MRAVKSEVALEPKKMMLVRVGLVAEARPMDVGQLVESEKVAPRSANAEEKWAGQPAPPALLSKLWEEPGKASLVVAPVPRPASLQVAQRNTYI